MANTRSLNGPHMSCLLIGVFLMSKNNVLKACTSYWWMPISHSANYYNYLPQIHINILICYPFRICKHPLCLSHFFATHVYMYTKITMHIDLANIYTTQICNYVFIWIIGHIIYFFDSCCETYWQLILNLDISTSPIVGLLTFINCSHYPLFLYIAFVQC